MGARISSEMHQAMDLIRNGKTPYRAAQETGLRLSTITRSRLYLAWKAEQEAQAQSKAAPR